MPMKYWDGYTVEEIAATFECDDRTIYRNKSRLVNKVKIMLFGADALIQNVKIVSG
nr:hypothetical protein [Dehalobacter restrictus]